MPSANLSNFGLVTVSTSTLSLTAAEHSGQTLAVPAAGCTMTLPDATGSGNTYRIITLADLTGDLVIQAPDADNVMIGIAMTDMTGVIFAAAADSDTITLNGTTKGGLAGATVMLQDVAADTWHVFAASEASGTEVTPFSADVS